MGTTYSLRFPFETAPNRKLTGLDQPVEWRLGVLTFELKRQDDQFYVLVVEGFDCENSAKEYAAYIWAGLMWGLLQQDVAFRASVDFGTVTYVDDPQRAADVLSKTYNIPIEGGVDGMINGNEPVVYPSDKNLRAVTIGTHWVLTTHAQTHYRPVLAEGLLLSNAALIVQDMKLKLALELYNDSFFELSVRSRFLVLVMVLEVLAVRQPRTKIVSDLISQWHKQVEQLREHLSAKDKDDLDALDSLGNEILHKQEMSIRYSIRMLVHDTLVSDGEDEITANQFADRARQIYDDRSTLIHNGTLSSEEQLHTAWQGAKEVVKRVLVAKFRQSGKPMR